MSATTTEPARVNLSEGCALLTVDDVAAMLSTTPGHVRDLSRRGRSHPIPRLKIGGAIRFAIEDVEHWVADQREA